jgi:hypothetical protein
MKSSPNQQRQESRDYDPWAKRPEKVQRVWLPSLITSKEGPEGMGHEVEGQLCSTSYH